MSIRICNLDKRYGASPVLVDLSFTLEEGEIYCLMGPSGAGKTTLLRVLLGLEPFQAGSIEGIDRNRVSAMFQEDRLCEALTAVENVLLVLPKSSSRTQVRALLQEILPADELDKPVMQMSGGQRRRVSLVRAVAYPSDIIVLDEPFTGLDSATRRQAIAFLLKHADGRTLLVSTHGEDDADLMGGKRIQLAELQMRSDDTTLERGV